VAVRGAPARATQEQAGHQNLATTQRCMQVSPAAVGAAIRLLDDPTGRGLGEMVETAESSR
jgi:hypothetical protein